MFGRPTLAFMEREEVNSLCGRLTGAFFELSNGPGAGFLEKVHEKALVQELALMGIGVRAQVPFSVFYKGLRVGQYLADLVVEGSLWWS
jgi:GxxExxY protein